MYGDGRPDFLNSRMTICLTTADVYETLSCSVHPDFKQADKSSAQSVPPDYVVRRGCSICPVAPGMTHQCHPSHRKTLLPNSLRQFVVGHRPAHLIAMSDLRLQDAPVDRFEL
jgi:hypothetical protein